MPFKDFATLEVLTAADVDAYLMRQGVMTFASAAARDAALVGGIVVEGMVAYLEDTNAVTVYDGAAWVEVTRVGLPTSYTPTLSQGASSNISKSVQRSRWSRLGIWTIWQFSIACTGAGTAGSAITLTLPDTCAFSGVPNGIGDGIIQDASGALNYKVAWSPTSTTTIIGYRDGSAAGAVGATPSFALASGDYLSGTVMFEHA
jgi:hypothetical protein